MLTIKEFEEKDSLKDPRNPSAKTYKVVCLPEELVTKTRIPGVTIVGLNVYLDTTGIRNINELIVQVKEYLENKDLY